MKRGTTKDTPRTDPGGPVLALCVGQRCTALRMLADNSGSVDDLKSAVKDSSGAVLITAHCLGPCAVAAVAAVAHREGGSGDTGRSVWLGGTEGSERSAALRQWIIDGGPSSLHRPDADVPDALAPAIIGLGQPPAISRKTSEAGR